MSRAARGWQALAQHDTDTGKRNRKGEPIIIEGYMDKPKGMAQIAWERGFYRPDCDAGKMHGKACNEDDTSGPDRSFSLVYVLSSCWDFAHEKTALEEVVESRGHILRMCVKGHLELAGVGVEYAWGRSKQVYRRHINDRVASHLHTNIVKSFSRRPLKREVGMPELVPLSMGYIRKSGRKTRCFRSGYRDGAGTGHADIEKHIKERRAHRNIIDSEYKFCTEGVNDY